MLPTIEPYDEVFIYRDRAALENWKQRPNSMIHLLADEEKLTVTIDDYRDPIIADILVSIRDYLEAAFGWSGPYPVNFAAVAQW